MWLSCLYVYWDQYTFLVFVVQAISLLIAQTLELIATLILLKYTAKPQHNFLNFFKGCNVSKERNWLLASAIGFGFLFTLVLGTSFLANGLLEPKVPVVNFTGFEFSAYVYKIRMFKCSLTRALKWLNLNETMTLIIVLLQLVKVFTLLCQKQGRSLHLAFSLTVIDFPKCSILHIKSSKLILSHIMHICQRYMDFLIKKM